MHKFIELTDDKGTSHYFNISTIESFTSNMNHEGSILFMVSNQKGISISQSVKEIMRLINE